MVSEKKIFICFSHYKSMGANGPGAWPVWAPGLDWQDLFRGPQKKMLHTKYISSGP